VARFSAGWNWLRHRWTGRPYFATRDVSIGRFARIGRNVRFHCKSVRIGDGVVIQDDVRIDADLFEMGDFGTIYRGCHFPGPGEVRMGHNVWIGTRAIIDAQGGARIGNNVCIGPHSQLWTHMVFGDTLQGCRFHSREPLTIEDEAWLGGNCLVSPGHIGARCLVLQGSVVTRDLAADRSYAGVPAEDVTQKIGPQFEDRPLDERVADLEGRLRDFGHGGSFEVVTGAEQIPSGRRDVTYFNVADRTYTKRGTELEAHCIRHLLPEAKFLPA
jgi:acetyltransferase-like isoleucine patch superfamily enzyme